jgi:DUF1365 family protein
MMDKLPKQALLSMGQVRHSRLRPAQNTFSYGVFTLMLPLRSLGDAALPSRLCSRNRFNLMSFYDRDHGDGKVPLLQWIDQLLKSEQVDDADGEIWLHAFARVCGYAFKPVSFWFCHRADGALIAVVAEVHNTFGERHVYLLADERAHPLKSGAELHALKAFHVSPFCAVQGGYRFRFINRPDRAVARIDYDDGDGPLLLTSLSGALEEAGRAQRLRALLGFPLFSAGVIARIHWHALRLWLARVPFHRKPAAPDTILTRGSP